MLCKHLRFLLTKLIFLSTDLIFVPLCLFLCLLLELSSNFNQILKILLLNFELLNISFDDVKFPLHVLVILVLFRHCFLNLSLFLFDFLKLGRELYFLGLECLGALDHIVNFGLGEGFGSARGYGHLGRCPSTCFIRLDCPFHLDVSIFEERLRKFDFLRLRFFSNVSSHVHFDVAESLLAVRVTHVKNELAFLLLVCLCRSTCLVKSADFRKFII